MVSSNALERMCSDPDKVPQKEFVLRLRFPALHRRLFWQDGL